MENTVTLTANTELTSGGCKYGAGMQFVADEATADALVKSGQASRVAPPVDQRPAVKSKADASQG